MLRFLFGGLLFISLTRALLAADPAPPFPADPRQDLERTCFQTGQAFSPNGDLRSDVAICYGIDRGLPARISILRRLAERQGCGRVDVNVLGWNSARAFYEKLGFAPQPDWVIHRLDLPHLGKD